MKRPLKYFPLISILLFISVLAISCGKEKSPLKFSVGENGDVSPIRIDPAKTDPAWASMKKNLFDESCTKCHNPDTANRKKRLDLTQKEIVLENAEDILYRMTDAFDMGIDYMPPKGNAVSPAVVKAFKVWRADAEFASIQKKLFEVSCLKCHGASQTKHSNLSSKQVVLEKFDDIIYKTGKAFEENNKPMPPAGKGIRVSEELIKELKDWKAHTQI